MKLLGIDIGGSGIKGGMIDIEKGEMIGERHRLETPLGAKPDDVAAVVAEIVRYFDWSGAVGCTFPAIVHHGVILSAANVDQSWISTNAQELISKATACPVIIINDADAAGVAEMKFGAGKNRKGVVILLTFGTGIGSALFLDGKLLPNTEFGHLQIRGKDAEHRASAKVKTDKDLSWSEWAERVNEFLAHLEFLFSPDLFIIGGGVSRKYDKFIPLLKTRAEIVPAELFNDAGIVGAAMAAQTLVPKPTAKTSASKSVKTAAQKITTSAAEVPATAIPTTKTLTSETPAKRGRPKKA